MQYCIRAITIIIISLPFLFHAHYRISIYHVLTIQQMLYYVGLQFNINENAQNVPLWPPKTSLKAQNVPLWPSKTIIKAQNVPFWPPKKSLHFNFLSLI